MCVPLRRWLAHLRSVQILKKSVIFLTARFLTNNEIGIVMSGGGARGPAHDGGLKCFELVEIPIDMIFGVSMGAEIGASFA